MCDELYGERVLNRILAELLARLLLVEARQMALAELLEEAFAKSGANFSIAANVDARARALDHAGLLHSADENAALASWTRQALERLLNRKPPA